MKKTKKSYKNIWMIAIVGLLAIFLLLIITKKQTQITPSSNNQNSTTISDLSPTIILPNNSKSYHSKLLGITIDVPDRFSIEDELGTITLKEVNTKDKIIISGIGTNSDSLDGYLIDITNYNRLEVTNKQNPTINGLPAIKAIINGKSYFLIYKNNWVATLMTSSTDLFDDLDQIAQSFHYTP